MKKKKNVFNKLNGLLEMPKDIAENIPKITMMRLF